GWPEPERNRSRERRCGCDLVSCPRDRGGDHVRRRGLAGDARDAGARWACRRPHRRTARRPAAGSGDEPVVKPAVVRLRQFDVTSERLACAALTSAVSVLLLAFGPAPGDAAVHLYRTFLVQHGVLL